MVSQILAVIGLLIIIGSLFFNVLAGTQLALLGIGCILLAIFNEVYKWRRSK